MTKARQTGAAIARVPGMQSPIAERNLRAPLALHVAGKAKRFPLLKELRALRCADISGGNAWCGVRGEAAVAVYRLFRNAGFDPEHIEGLSKAYDDTLRSLQLVNRTDPLTELIAKTIIRAAQTGERNPDRLRESTIAELGLGAAPRSSVENGADEVPAKGRSLTVLLVDDDATFAYAASRFFRARGHTPLVAPGSIAAFRELERQPVDAVITDIRLGDGEPHGAALGRMIRNRDPKMPVLLVTAYPDLLESEKPLPGPAFIKPVELRELARVVEASVAA